MSLLVVRGDAARLPLPDASVDLIVTSPPYFALRSYTDGGTHYAGQIGSEATPAAYIADLVECTREWMRVLKPSGSAFINLGDKYAGGGGFYPDSPVNVSRRSDTAHQEGSFTVSPSLKSRGTGRANGRTPEGTRTKSLMLLPERYRIACVDQLGLIARAVIVWAKPNGLPESVTDRVRRSHEDWVHLTRSPRYFAAVDEIREASQQRPGLSWEQRKANGHPTRYGEQASALTGTAGFASNALGKLPGSVWEIATEPLQVPAGVDVDHFAAFPSEWPRRLVLGWSPPRGTVVDPCGGTGTTAHVAAALGRIGITVDLSLDYSRLAAHPELADRRRRKVLGLDKPVLPVIPEGQLGFDWEDVS